MSYRVKEIFLSLQGEGFHAGRVAVLCRFSGCNLWSGREEHRGAAACRFCDTDFVGTDGPAGGVYASAAVLADAVAACWPAGGGAGATGGARPFVVLTGGEPLLQVDPPLLAALRDRGIETAVETNGTRTAPGGIDWVCVSPKSGADLALVRGDELKLVHPQPGLDPAALEHLDFRHFFLQPLDGPDRAVATRRAVEYCLEHPRWRLSLQMHKLLGIR